MFLHTTNKNYDLWLFDKQPTNQQTRKCHLTNTPITSTTTPMCKQPRTRRTIVTPPTPAASTATAAAATAIAIATATAGAAAITTEHQN